MRTTETSVEPMRRHPGSSSGPLREGFVRMLQGESATWTSNVWLSLSVSDGGIIMLTAREDDKVRAS